MVMSIDKRLLAAVLCASSALLGQGPAAAQDKLEIDIVHLGRQE